MKGSKALYLKGRSGSAGASGDADKVESMVFADVGLPQTAANFVRDRDTEDDMVKRGMSKAGVLVLVLVLVASNTQGVHAKLV